MNENTKCFIKIGKGIYEEITYKELTERRKNFDTYKNKKFIYLHKMLMEVSTQEYEEYYREIERNRYAEKVLEKLNVISIDEIREHENFRDKDILKDNVSNTENEVLKHLEINKLKDALLKLTEEEFEIIRALFYEEIPLRKYAKNKKIPLTTLFDKKEKILKKLKKLINI